MLPETMDLHAGMVVDVDVLLLGDGEELIVVKPTTVSHRLCKLQLAPQPPFPPVHRSHMALASGEQEATTVPGILGDVWSKALQLELEALLGRLDVDVPSDLVLPYLVRLLELVLGLQEARFILEENLGILGLERGVLVFYFQRLQLSTQLLILDTSNGDPAPSCIGVACLESSSLCLERVGLLDAFRLSLVPCRAEIHRSREAQARPGRDRTEDCDLCVP